MEDTQGKRTFWCAGWRPAIGWICAIALAWSWVLAPIVEVILKACGIPIIMPRLQSTEIVSLTTSLLGMSALRTYDKKNGLTQ